MSNALICGLATAPLMVRGSSFNERCARCWAHLMIPPSGQRFLKAHPLTTTICWKCFRPEDYDNADMATDTETVRAELRDLVPNFWVVRN